MHHELITGFVLAGGKSTRMGRDKAVLQLEGRTLLEHALDVLRQAVGPSERAEGQAEKSDAVQAGADKNDFVCILGPRQLYSGYGVPVIEDIYPGCGPLSGIHAALTHTRTEFNLIIAVDTPFLSAGFLRFMVDRAVESGAVVTTPEIAGYRQPLCSVYSREFLAIAEAALRGTNAHSPRRHPPQQAKTGLAGGPGHGGTEENENLTADQRGSSRIENEGKAAPSAAKSRDYKIVPLFPEDRTLVITEDEMRRFAFTPEMFENLNTPDDLERARQREQKA